MERASAALLHHTGHHIQSFINDGMDLCVLLQVLQVQVLTSIQSRVLLPFLGF